MKVQDIHKAFKVTLDKNSQAVAYGGCPAFLPAEEDLFLNQAYYEIISNKFTGTTVTKVAFEGSVNRISDLEKLVCTDTDATLEEWQNSNVLLLRDFSAKSDVEEPRTRYRMFYVNSVLHFGDKSQTCTLVDHETARRFLKTYDNDPWIATPIATIENNTLKLYIDTHTMSGPYSLDITYVKYPEVIDYTKPDLDIDEVPDRVMYEVINRAAVIALENIESQRTGTKVQINNLQE